MIALALLLGLITAIPSEPCRYTMAMALTDLRSQIPQDQQIRQKIYRGSDAIKITAAFNDLPPKSSIQADEVRILYHPRLPIVLILFGYQGCSVDLYQTNEQAIDDLVGSALGKKI